MSKADTIRRAAPLILAMVENYERRLAAAEVDPPPGRDTAVTHEDVN